METAAVIDCVQRCEIPEGVRLTEVPPPRHDWSDTIVCPDCGRSFLVDEQRSDS